MGILDRSSAREIKLISTLFFLSGLSGLSYEVIWFKQFSHVWGSSTLAMASVVGAFLFGLGLGARLWGAIADRVTRPVLWYGVCEIGIGLLALLITWEADLLWKFSIHYYARLRDWPVWYALVRCATTFVVIGPPCVLMGGTLPLLVRKLALIKGLGSAAGLLYGINTLGAAVGCYLMGFHLLPELGLFWSNVAIAVANIGIGLVAVGVATRRGPIDDSVSEPSEAATTLENQQPMSAREFPVSIIYILSAITGFAALALQVVWNRQLALVLGSSTYAFSAMLFVVLAGIGLGSLLFRSLIVNFAGGISLALYLLSATVLSTVAGMWLVPFAADCVGVSLPLRASYATNAMMCIAASALVEFVPAVAMGALFPCLIHIGRGKAATAGAVVGTLYACNTAGTLAGAIATSGWLVPTWGTHAAVGIALIAYIGAATLLSTSARTNVRGYVALAIGSVACGLYWKTTDDPQRTNRGMFLYGYSNLEQNSPEVLFFKEGAASNVLVTKQGNGISFRVNGKVDGSTENDMAMQLGLAYLPRFLNPNASNVLVIGFGTGTTSGASLLFPDTNVTCCEIEPAIVAAAPHFAKVNHSPQESSRFTVVYDDARAYVQGTNEKYDLILSEPSNPWIAGVSNLFTAEFYRIAKQKLAANGIFAQWIQTYAFRDDDYTMVIRTMREAFPYQRLIRISPGDTILLGANESLDRDRSIVEASQRLVDASSASQADLSLYFRTTDVAALLLTRLLLDEPALEKLVDSDGSRRLNLDRDVQLEFRAARHLYQRREGNVGQLLLGAARPGWFVDQYDRLGCEVRHASSLHDLAALFLSANLKVTAAALVELGLNYKPTSPDLLADKLILAKNVDHVILESLLASSDGCAGVAASRVGVSYWENKNYSDAVVVFERLSEKFPNAPNIWTNLAINQALLGNRQQAEFAHRRALESDPTNNFSRQASESFASHQAGSEARGMIHEPRANNEAPR